MEGHVAGIVDALHAQTDALRAQRAEQRVGEEHAYTLTKEAETILNPPFLLAMMLYPSTIAFSLQARSYKFGLLIPTASVPGTTPTDQMDLMGPRNDNSSVLLTIFAFLTVMGLHTYILLHLRTRLVATLAWLPTVSFWGFTTTYFIAYMSMNRYGVGRFDMIFTIVCSTILLVMTLIFIVKPVPHVKVIKTRNIQAHGAQQ